MPLSRLFNLDLSDGRCHRPDCAVCLGFSGNAASKCKTKSVVYRSACSLCEQNGSREGNYIGETARSLHERSREHLEDAIKMKSSSHIWKHWALTHPDQLTMPVFNFKVLRSHKSCLDRQIHEAIKISTDGILNTKCEYRQNQVKRLSTNLTAREMKAEELQAAKLDSQLDQATKNLALKLQNSGLIVKNKLNLTIPDIYLPGGFRESGCPADFTSGNQTFPTDCFDQDSVFTDSSYKRPNFEQVPSIGSSKRIRLDFSVVQATDTSDYSASTEHIRNKMGRRSHGRTNNESKHLFKRSRAEVCRNVDEPELLRATPCNAVMPSSFADIALQASKKTQEREQRFLGGLNVKVAAPIKIFLDQSSSSLAQSSASSDLCTAYTGSDHIPMMSPLSAMLEGDISLQVLRMNIGDDQQSARVG